MVIRKSKVAARLGVAFTAAALVVPLVTAGTANAAKAPSTTSFPRAQTLYTSGTAYSPPTIFNPLSPSAYTGTEGYLYETLFLYDPASNKTIPWLATSGSWSGNVYTIHVRNGVDWTQGPSVVGTLTGADVAYSILLSKTNSAVPFSNVGPYIKNATASGNTVTVTFNGTPAYTAWAHYLWTGPIVPKSVFSKMSAAEQVSSPNWTSSVAPVGTGAMYLADVSSTQACYQDNPNWWAIKALGISLHFKYNCDIVNGSNAVELSSLLSNQLDWSNNFLPGISSLLTTGGDTFLKTYYPKAPYMMSANTAWLEMNTSKAPMSNLNFRKAVAAAINPQSIVLGDYDNIVSAANPTGLLPNLKQYVSSSVVKKYGFTYSPSQAKMYLAESGYKGQTLTIEVPDGWTDWMSADQIIASELNAVGIHVDPILPSSNKRTADMEDGAYDMMIDNNAGPNSSPWAYFDRVYSLPIQKPDTGQLNVERYTDHATWNLVQAAGKVPLTDSAKLDSMYAQIETNFLKTLPEIPLWYNGAWFQGNTTFWKGYPSSTNPSDAYTPVMWGGWLGNMTTILALAQLRAG